MSIDTSPHIARLVSTDAEGKPFDGFVTRDLNLAAFLLSKDKIYRQMPRSGRSEQFGIMWDDGIVPLVRSYLRGESCVEPVGYQRFRDALVKIAKENAI
jgi:hypothetical protein